MLHRDKEERLFEHYLQAANKSAPALELVALPRSCEPHIGRATSSVGVMYRVSGPNTGSNPGGGRILKKKKKKKLLNKTA